MDFGGWSTPNPNSNPRFLSGPYNRYDWDGRMYPSESGPGYGWNVPPPPSPYSMPPPVYPPGYYQYQNHYFQEFSEPFPSPFFQRPRFADPNPYYAEPRSFQSHLSNTIAAKPDGFSHWDKYSKTDPPHQDRKSPSPKLQEPSPDSDHCLSCFKIFGASSTDKRYPSISSIEEHAQKHAEEKESSHWKKELNRCFPKTSADGTRGKEAQPEENCINNKVLKEQLKTEDGNEDIILDEASSFCNESKGTAGDKFQISMDTTEPTCKVAHSVQQNCSNRNRRKMTKAKGNKKPTEISRGEHKVYLGKNLPHEKIIRQIMDADPNVKSFPCQLCGHVFKGHAFASSHAISHMKEKEIFICLFCGYKGKQIRAHWSYRHKGTDFDTANVMFYETNLVGKTVEYANQCFGTADKNGIDSNALAAPKDSKTADFESVNSESGPQEETNSESKAEADPAITDSVPTIPQCQSQESLVTVKPPPHGRKYRKRQLPKSSTQTKANQLYESLKLQKAFKVQCRKCLKELTSSIGVVSKTQLLNHVYSHSGLPLLNCRLCSFSTPYFATIRSHFDKRHPEVTMYQESYEDRREEFDSKLSEIFTECFTGTENDREESKSPDFCIIR